MISLDSSELNYIEARNMYIYETPQFKVTLRYMYAGCVQNYSTIWLLTMPFMIFAIEKRIFWWQLLSHLNNYFDFHVWLSICRSVRLVLVPVLSVQTLTSIPASVSQNVNDKSCLVSVKSEKYASWFTLRPQWDRLRRGEAEVRILDFKTTWSVSEGKSDC